ncbi:MAG: hypothetical protein PHY48_16600, partial [Candidatus Cloacimonetes bacterium]|nr:hypothetical protein [Candidatus Cloacimonadota bacterium]
IMLYMSPKKGFISLLMLPWGFASLHPRLISFVPAGLCQQPESLRDDRWSDVYLAIFVGDTKTPFALMGLSLE